MHITITKDKQASLPAGTLDRTKRYLARWVKELGGITLTPFEADGIQVVGAKVIQETPRSRQYLSIGSAVSIARSHAPAVGQFELIAREGGAFLIQTVTDDRKRKTAEEGVAYYTEYAAEAAAKIPAAEKALQQAKVDFAAKLIEVAEMANDYADGEGTWDALRKRMWDVANEDHAVRNAQTDLDRYRVELECSEDAIKRHKAALEALKS